MDINCAQMEILLSFYIEDNLSYALKAKVEEHLEKCASCRAKYEIVQTLLNDLRSSLGKDISSEDYDSNEQYTLFQQNLSAYVDNELSSDESIKIKKYTINNKKARKELENVYNIRRLMGESFSKTKSDARRDYSKKIIKQLNPQEEYSYVFHPVLKIAVAFVITVLVLSVIILFSLTM